MPASLAHHQFGQDVLCRLDADIRSFALAHKREFDIGLQGPDIFFYYRPYRKNKISGYGIERHSQPASRMFAPIWETLRENAALSYLMGLVCHYTLDRDCHPYVNGHSRDALEHLRMESAYDRHVMSCRGLTTARYLLVPDSGLDYGAMASLWPGMTAGTVRACVRSQRRYTWLLDHGKFLSFCETAAHRRGAFMPLTLPSCVSGVQQEHARRLESLYGQALDECPELIRRVIGAMGARWADCEGFDLNYEGEAADGPGGEAPAPL